MDPGYLGAIHLDSPPKVGHKCYKNQQKSTKSTKKVLKSTKCKLRMYKNNKNNKYRRVFFTSVKLVNHLQTYFPYRFWKLK